MFRKIIARLGTRLKEIADAIIAKVGTAIRQCMPSLSASAGIRKLIVPIESKNALNFGKQYRLTSGHAPIFSLFTYFGLRN
ncbi:MAG: hypothetical protein NTZ39_02360 [Methanoregula sp.]|nr:hypothetical protein [Methanoregula sp.]